MNQFNFKLNNNFTKELVKDCVSQYFQFILSQDTMYLSHINILSNGILKNVCHLQYHSNSILDQENLINVIYNSIKNIINKIDNYINKIALKSLIEQIFIIYIKQLVIDNRNSIEYIKKYIVFIN